MSDNILIDVSTTLENVNVEVVEASAASIGIEYFYPQGPAGVNEWGTISGTLSTQTDLWSYLSAVGTSNFDIATLNNYLSTNNILLCSLNVNGQILSAGTDLFDIFLTSETDSQTLSYIPSSYLLSISNGNTVNLSSINSTFAANSAKYESVYSNVQSNSADWNSVYQTAITSVNDFTGHNITLNNYIYTTASQNVSSNRKYAFDTTTEILTAVLPPTPQAGDEIEFFDIFGTWNINPLVITNNTKRIEQLSDNLNCNIRFGLIKLIYTNNNIGWRIVPMSRHSVPIISAPSVSISADTDVGALINFTGINNLDPEIGPVTNWYWNLTGGSTPDYFTQNVTYTYGTSGIYTVNLTGSNSVGTGTASRAITAVPLLSPVPAILASSFTGDIPFTVTLSGTNTLPVSSSPVTNWYWNLTGGSTPDYFTQNVTYTYSTSGTYLVTLTAANAFGSGTTTQDITASVSNVPPGYLAFWKLDDTSDSSANNNDLTNTGGVQFVAGKIGNCALFDGSNVLGTTSFTPTFDASQDFSISFWANPTSNVLGTTIGSSGFNIHNDSSGVLNFNNGAAGDCNVAGAFTVGTWKHYVCIKAGGMTKVYINNVEEYNQSSAVSYTGTTNTINIGRWLFTQLPFEGYIDAVGIWQRELTLSEISALYNSDNGLEP